MTSLIFADLQPEQTRAARSWLRVGLLALALAGIYSVLIVLARTPAFSGVISLSDLFHRVLVPHVDLSVLVWFLAMIGVMCQVCLRPPTAIPLLPQAAAWAMGMGAVLIALSPLEIKAIPIMSNYIPVLTGGVFFLGLGAVASSVVLLIIQVVLSPDMARIHARNLLSREAEMPAVAVFFCALMAMVLALALACFAWSVKALAVHEMLGQDYYEVVFWGGGHVLQFAYTIAMMLALTLLANAMKRPFLSPRAVAWLGILAAFPVMFAPLPYLHFTPESVAFRQSFTQLMVVANGVAPGLFLLAAAWALMKGKWCKAGCPHPNPLPKGEGAIGGCYAMALAVFAFGGVLGLMIQGQNVVIPAHYHGAIVGVTLAMMGVAYWVAPQLGLRDLSMTRMARWQPFVYGGGQLIHISALAWSGGYGVLRKTPGALEGYSASVKFAMGLMGMGGLIAIIGGLMFVVVMMRSFLKEKAAV